jgi:hypothetical protein
MSTNPPKAPTFGGDGLEDHGDAVAVVSRHRADSFRRERRAVNIEGFPGGNNAL